MNKGFQMTFENGWTISVQWGIGNYCSRGHISSNPMVDMKTDVVSSPDCEIMIWCNEQNFSFGNDDVKGYCSADEVAEWIFKVKNF